MLCARFTPSIPCVHVHFAGEHTNGYGATLNAAVQSGERAAGEVAKQV
ncbi:FAD-dependent oxidoreductase [Yinghuangia aomiensis]